MFIDLVGIAITCVITKYVFNQEVNFLNLVMFCWIMQVCRNIKRRG